MPAIASLEDLKAAQKDGSSIYPMLYLSRRSPLTGRRRMRYAHCFSYGHGHVFTIER